MPTRDGNKINYEGDPGMDNSEGGGVSKMGFMGGGFGAPGVRESKKVGADTEITIPVKQSLTIAIGTALLLISIYGVVKIFVTTFSDWLLLIGIVTIVGLPVLLIGADRLLKYQTPNFYAGVVRAFNSVIYGHNLAAFILMVLAIIFVAYFIGEFYVSVIARQMAFTLNDQWHVVILICAVIGWMVAYNPFKIFFTKQLTNSLRDSDSKYATQSLLLEDEWRKRKAGIIDGEFYPVEDTPQSSQKLLGHHIVANPSAAKSITPRTEDQYFNMLVNEFLDGIESGQWGTSERSWKKKRLIKAGVDLPVVGDAIRDALISSNWAEWQHPGQPHLGWSLVAPISEIRNGALLKGKNETAPSTDSDVAVGVYEWSPESEDAEDSE